MHDPQTYWHQDLILCKAVFSFTEVRCVCWGGAGGRWVAVVQDDSSTLLLLCTLFLFLLHQLQLRSASIRYQRLGTLG